MKRKVSGLLILSPIVTKCNVDEKRVALSTDVCFLILLKILALTTAIIRKHQSLVLRQKKELVKVSL